MLRCHNIYRLVCQPKGDSNDLTGFVRTDLVGEQQAEALLQKLTQENPGWTTEQVQEEFAQQIFEPKKRRSLEAWYHWVLRAIERFIERQPSEIFTSREKKQLRARLRATQFQLPPPASLYQDEPDLLTRSGAFYERTPDNKMRFRIGGGYILAARSRFNIINTLAHELAHAIDPCEILDAHLSFPAYDRLTACFLKTKLIATPKNRSECGAHDQLSEAFADWVATQIVSEYLSQFATEFRGAQIVNAARNSVRDLCDDEEEPQDPSDLEFHPSARVRIEKIFGAHPTIRHLLGCEPDETPPPYCFFEPEFPIYRIPEIKPDSF